MKTLLTLYSVLFSLSAFAQTPAQTPVAPPVENTDAAASDEPESWYFNFGFGVAFSPEYGASTISTINNLKALGNDYIRVPLTLDLGVYFPLPDQKTLLGGSLIAIVDNMKVADYELTITQAAIALSAVTYFGEGIGNGAFLRGDIGPAGYSTKTRFASSTITTTHSDTGYMYQLGAGYSLPTFSGASLSLGLFYSKSKVKDDQAHSFSLQGSCLL